MQVAEHTLTGPENENRFAVLDGDCCWIADVQLAEYEIHAAEGRLTPKLITGQDSVFPQPPLVTGKTVFSVRRGETLPGTLVSALDAATQNDLWQTSLATPLAAGPLPEADGKLTAVTAVGAMFQITPPQPHSDAIADQPVLTIPLGQIGAADQQRDCHERRHVCHDLRHGVEPDRALRSPAAAAIPLAHGASAGYHDLSAYSPGRRAARALQERPNLPARPAIHRESGRAVRAGVEDRSGLELAPAGSGGRAGGGHLRRRPPALPPGDRCQRRRPSPHLSTQQEAKSPKAIASSLAVAGSVAYAVDAAGTLRSFELPSLAEGKTYKLPGGCTWGPQGIGNHVMLTTDNGQLICLDDRQNLLWQINLPYGPLAGPPWATAGQFILASQSGVVWRVDAASGKELGKVETASPLGTGPVALGNRLFVGSHDGCIYEVQVP